MAHDGQTERTATDLGVGLEEEAVAAMLSLSCAVELETICEGRVVTEGDGEELEPGPSPPVV